jgi:hypothetical protein
MHRHSFIAVLSLALALSSCKWLNDSKSGAPTSRMESGDNRPLEAETVTITPETAGSSTQGLPPAPVDSMPEEPKSTPAPEPTEATCDGLRLIIATDQLGQTAWDVQIDFNGVNVVSTLTPKPQAASLCLKGLTPANGVLLTLRLMRGGDLRFIAKLANASYTLNQSAPIVIDNCRIHPAPWDGRSNDGSCEWTITEVGPG